MISFHWYHHVSILSFLFIWRVFPRFSAVLQQFNTDITVMITSEYMEDHITELRSEIMMIIVVVPTTQLIVKLKPEKNSGLNGIRTHVICNTSAVHYQLTI